MTAPSALPGLDAIRRRADHLPLSVPDRHEHVMDVVRLIAAVEAAAEVEASAEPHYVLGRRGHCKWAVCVDKAALVHLRTALAAFAEVPAPPVSHTDAVWQEGDDGGDGGLTLQAMQSAVNAAGLATAHLGDEVWDGDDEPAPFEERLRRERERRLAAAPWHYWKAAGRPDRPLEEHYCDHCAGWFGVPHDNQHREGVCRSAGTGQCACIDCWVYEGRTEAVRS